MDFVKQTKQASLSLSPCLTPRPSTTAKHLLINHLRISKPNLNPSPPTCILLLSSTGHLFTPFVCFKMIQKVFSALLRRPLWTIKLGWYLKSKFRTFSVSRIQTHYTVTGGSELVVLGLHTDLSSMLGCDWWRLNLWQIFSVFLFSSSSPFSPQPSRTKTCPLHTSVFNNMWITCAGCVQTSGRQHKRDVTYIEMCVRLGLDLKCLRCIRPHISILLQIRTLSHTFVVLCAWLLFTLSTNGQDQTLLLSLVWSWDGRAPHRGSCLRCLLVVIVQVSHNVLGLHFHFYYPHLKVIWYETTVL